MRSWLLALCCVCVAGVFALAFRALRAPDAAVEHASVPSIADDVGRDEGLRRELDDLRREVDALRVQTAAPTRTAADPEPARVSTGAQPTQDPAWYLREYERSFDGKPNGSDYFRLAVEAWIVDLAPAAAARLSDRGADATFRTSLARLLADRRLSGNGRVVDALFAALFDARPEALGVAALEALAIVGDAGTGLALEKAWDGLGTETLRERALAVVLALAAPEENRAIARLYARVRSVEHKVALLRRLKADAGASALDVLRPASTDEDVARLAAAETLRDLRGPAFLAFVDEWLGYERNEAVRRALGASRERMTTIPSYAPEKAIGPPDAVPSQDHPNAWASLRPDMGTQWLEVGFDPPRRANAIRIHEVCVAGAVSRVVAIDESGGRHVVWSGVDPTSVPGVFEVAFAPTGFRVARVRIELDTDRASGWSEIDAVQLAGPDGTAWASSASASSTFGQR